MKQFFAAAVVLACAACNDFSKPESPKSGVFYGDSFDTTNAWTTGQLVQQVRTNGKAEAVVLGTVTQSCQTEGCWVKLDAGDGREVFVSTEQNFAVPKEIAGKNVFVKGYAYLDTTSVEDLREEAKAHGKSNDDVNGIAEPKVNVSLKATGIAVR
ncbi:MAG TPA: DUF4920 domain-containing protein [Chitinophagales bacterium]|nr:DUF4920 domain-containing protein [Chitinophagales bacterium]